MISEKEDIQQSHRATNLLCHASKRDEIERTYPFRDKNEFGEFWQSRNKFVPIREKYKWNRLDRSWRNVYY